MRIMFRLRLFSVLLCLAFASAQLRAQPAGRHLVVLVPLSNKDGKQQTAARRWILRLDKNSGCSIRISK
jgi:hypothetical protein